MIHYMVQHLPKHAPIDLSHGVFAAIQRRVCSVNARMERPAFALGPRALPRKVARHAQQPLRVRRPIHQIRQQPPTHGRGAVCGRKMLRCARLETRRQRAIQLESRHPLAGLEITQRGGELL